MLPTAAVLAAAGLLVSLAAGLERFGAMEELAPNRLLPRYFGDSEPQLPRRHVKRQAVPCNPGFHLCVDVFKSDACCPNSQYCYVRPDFAARCCQQGSNCDSACDSTAYQCSVTATVAGVATVTSSCCSRQCGAGSYLCPAALGGQCCAYGDTCAAGGTCVAPSTTSTTRSAVVTPLDPGCTVGQHGCSDSGGGCCDAEWHCTRVNDSAVCAPGAPTSTNSRSPPPASGDGGGGLSAGAKAGIGVGAALGVAALVGITVWVCLVKRRSRQSSNRSGGGVGGGDGPAMSEVTQSSRPRPHGGARDYSGPAPVAGPFTDLAGESDGAAAGPGGAGGMQRGAVPVDPHGPDDIAAPVEIDSRMKSAFVEEVGEQQSTPAATTGETQIFELYGSEIHATAAAAEMPSPTAVSPGAGTLQTVTDMSPTSPTAGTGTLRTVTDMSPTSPSRGY